MACLQSLAELFLHHNHNPKTRESPPTTTLNPFPNEKCSDIPFPHDTILMIHELPSLKNEDPCLPETFSNMCAPGIPRYGLGYLE